MFTGHDVKPTKSLDFGLGLTIFDKPTFNTKLANGMDTELQSQLWWGYTITDSGTDKNEMSALFHTEIGLFLH